VLKKYHPHGDSAVYDALVRMAQPWNLRYLLVDGQGNFGSVDGDPAAAYRYTECKMTKLAEELLVDIDKETVDFCRTSTAPPKSPTSSPAAFPNLLVNGSEGIAVGMATKIPPHNLGEVIDACVASSTTRAPVRRAPGDHARPRLPHRGTIYGREGIREAYATGRGRVIVRGRASSRSSTAAAPSSSTRSRTRSTRPASSRSIAELVRTRSSRASHALRDESDRHGMRVVIELKRDAYEEVVLNHLYKHTSLQSTFGVILLAIVNNRPRVLTLREML
jgi:DNA gyrase subunit A